MSPDSLPAPTPLVDICVNLLNGQFRNDTEVILERAFQAGVHHLVVTATDMATSRQAIDFCNASKQARSSNSNLLPNCVTTAGVHPHDAKLQMAKDGNVSSHSESLSDSLSDTLSDSGTTTLPLDWAEELAELASAEVVRAIGETGLDFYRNYVSHAEQREVFKQQIDIATEIGKPLFVHDRDTEGEVLNILHGRSSLPEVVVHCFTGNEYELRGYIEANFYIGLTGWITDPKRGQDLVKLAPLIPPDRLLIETDAPFLKPATAPTDFHTRLGLPSKFKRRNEPCLLPYVAAGVAKARGESLEILAAQTTANAMRLFGLTECL